MQSGDRGRSTGVTPKLTSPAAPAWTPTIVRVPGNAAGKLLAQPYGCIVHGTRSGRSWTLAEEFSATVNYVIQGADGLGWHCTIGEGIIAMHMQPDQWGWHAGTYSRSWLGVEFAQPTVDYDITDEQIGTFVWWWREVVMKTWPGLESNMLAHSESRQGIESGKTDPFPVGDKRNDELRHRILGRL